MQFVFLHPLHPYGLERSQPDMQGDFGVFYAPLLELIQDLRREMQACGWSGNRATLSRINGLIAITIGGTVLALDIRRQGNMLQLFDSSEEVRHWRKTDAPFAKRSPRNHLGFELILVAKEEFFADADLAPWPHQALPLIRFLRQLPG